MTATIVTVVPRNEPLLHVPWSREMIGRVPACSTARPLEFIATSIEPWKAPTRSKATVSVTNEFANASPGTTTA